jgi:spermidine/putrescine transport system substrate-binding protein
MAPEEVTRRAFLRRAGAGAAGVAIGGPALLAACSRSASRAREVRVFNEPLAIDDTTPKHFELSTGIFLRYHEYTDPAAYLAREASVLRAHRDIGADVVVVPDGQTAKMIEAGWVRRLPVPPPGRRILPAFAGPRFDPGRRFSLPWSSTVIGLAFDRRRVHEPVRSASALFDPRFAGKVELSADPAATLGLVLYASGDDPAAVTESQAAAAVQRIRGAVASGQVRSFATTEYVDDLVSGRALLAVARADEIRAALPLSPTLAFVVPREGGLLDSTNMVVPIGARNVEEAAVFIDYMFKPDPSSRLASFGSRVMPVRGALTSLEAIDPKSALDHLVQPDPAVWSRLAIWGGTVATDRATSDFAALVASHAT